jgi:protein kinase-like protein/putative zinc finger protein
MISAVHPEPEVLVEFADDTLAPEARIAVEQHLDDCDDCRATVSMMARAATAERASQPALAPTLEGTAFGPTEAVPRETVESLRRAPQSPLAPGTKVGRYVIGDTLGIGGMGIVYAARDPDLDRDIAIKILRPELLRVQPDATKRIIREAQAMARVAHPNVVAVFDVGTVEDRVFVAMERVTGTNLRAWLSAARRSPAEILEVSIAAGRGLAAAHDAGMVHRDFKPDNVFVGDDGRVRVGDFGLAYEHDGGDDLEVTGESTTRPVAGTPAYMPPEQHEGRSVDPRGDQFSFAVTLYEALYGERPFAGRTREAIADAISRGHIQPAPAGARVPASLRAILVRALAVTPGDRFPTLAEMLKALGRDRSRRPRQLALVALVALIAVGVALGADWIMRERAHAVTRTSFEAARTQLDKLVSLRTDMFVAQSEALYRLPALQEVAALRDLADFGLGDESEDRARLARIHDNLRSADWFALTHTRRGDAMAVADYKGRLLFGSANPDGWGANIGTIPMIASAYASKADAYIGVLRADDPSVVASGLLGAKPSAKLYVAFARAKRIGEQTRALFVELAEAARVLDDVGVGEDTKLSVTAAGGAAEGTVPTEVLDIATDSSITELSIDSQDWLVERTPLRASGQSDEIAQIVLARRSDAGLSGLFPHARMTLALLALALAGIAIAGWIMSTRGSRSRPARPPR